MTRIRDLVKNRVGHVHGIYIFVAGKMLKFVRNVYVMNDNAT